MNASALLGAINQYGLIAVFIMIALEYACFPVPSELVLPFAGAFACRNDIPFSHIIAVSAAAGLCGSLTCYCVGRFGGGAIIKGLEKRFPGMQDGLDASENWFGKYGGISVMAGRVLPLCRTYISFIAGLSRQNPVSFCAFSLIGILVWNFVLIGFGFKLADHWGTVTLIVKKYTAIILPAVLLLIFFIICRIRKGKKSKHNPR